MKRTKAASIQGAVFLIFEESINTFFYIGATKAQATIRLSITPSFLYPILELRVVDSQYERDGFL